MPFYILFVKKNQQQIEKPLLKKEHFDKFRKK